MNAIRVTPGAISLSICSHFPIMGKSMNVKPVMFPPGRARLAMKPCPSGSMTPTKTIGMVRVSCFSATSTPVLMALKQETRTIPIVFVGVIDPLGQGFIASLARPGGNITGFTFIDFPMIGKWLQMLKEIAPGVTRMAFMFNPDTAPYYPVLVREFAATASLSAELSETPVRDEAEIEAAVLAFAREPGAGLIVAAEPFMNTRRGLIIALAERHRLPAVYGFRQFVTEGALISYGPDIADSVRRSASYVDRILKGEKPADLPVQAPTKYELVINLKTAKAL